MSRWTLIQTKPIRTRMSNGLSLRLTTNNIPHKRRTVIQVYRVKPNARTLRKARERSGMKRRRWALALGFEWAGNIRDIEVGKVTLPPKQWGRLLQRAIRLSMVRSQHIPT